MWSSGWGADIGHVDSSLEQALSSNRPLQINKFPWHYAAPDAVKKANKGRPSPNACPTLNMNCYFLNISNCPSLNESVFEKTQHYFIERHREKFFREYM
mmetsp:Transcript_20233/g.30671  ORF Transcript_20233/g.30671 Transcript_20233/m.30671 type:complete len:99 (-) Transcript_20233:444-740(-)